MTRLCFVACVALGTLLGSPTASRAQTVPTGSAVLLENVNVIPMDRERVLRDQVVLVRGGIVAAIAPRGTMSAPPGATRIDAGGGYLIPGLTDAHVHLYYGTASLSSYLAHGVTTIFNLNGSPDVLDARRAIATGPIAGPTIYTAGPTIDGAPPLNTLFTSVATSGGARRVVAAQKRAGYDFIKVYSNLDSLSYLAILDEARLQRLPVVGHIPVRVGWRTALTRSPVGGQSAIAHMEEFFQSPITDSDFGEVVRLATAAKRADGGFAVIPNLFAYSDYLRAISELPSLRGVLNDPEMRYTSPAAYSEKLPANNRANRPNPEQFAAALRTQQARFRVLTRMFRDAGVPLLVGTDTEIFGFPGQSTQLEMRELVASGLTPYDALRAATANAGAFVAAHVPNATRFGTIAVGNVADLVLLAANPLDSIGNIARINGVVLRGRWFSAQRLSAMRDSVARALEGSHSLVARADSLANNGRVREAVAAIRTLRARFPGFVPVAEVVIRAWGRRLIATDTAGAMMLRTLATELFPQSFSAWGELARGDLVRGDTVSAVAHLRRAATLSPHDEWIAQQLARVCCSR